MSNALINKLEDLDSVEMLLKTKPDGIEMTMTGVTPDGQTESFTYLAPKGDDFGVCDAFARTAVVATAVLAGGIFPTTHAINGVTQED